MRDPRWIFAFSTLGCVFVLAMVIAVGTVTADHSFGLQYLLGALSGLLGAIGVWAYTHKGD